MANLIYVAKVLFEPRSAFKALFRYHPDLGSLTLYLPWAWVSLWNRQEAISRFADSGPGLFGVAIIIPVALLHAWIWVHLLSFSVFYGGKLVGSSLDFNRVRLVVKWSVIPSFLSACIALLHAGGASVSLNTSLYAMLMLLGVPAIGYVWSFIILISGVNALQNNRIQAIASVCLIPGVLLLLLLGWYFLGGA
ncbi:MAG: hypothetical protein R3208_01135 [Ketobacteraceae bacterium]|nr:hypothetical protein [Ketobacteraceae bacterium]